MSRFTCRDRSLTKVDDHSPLFLLFLCCCRTVILKLKAIGIPADALPVTDDSKLIVHDHLNWVANKRKEEEAEVLEPPSKRSRSQRERKSDFNPESISALCKSSTSNHRWELEQKTNLDAAAISNLCKSSSSCYTVG